MASPRVSLSVNDVPIPIKDFIQGFIEHVITGMLAVLKRTEEISDVYISIDSGIVGLTVDNSIVPVNPFVNKFIKNTVVGMVSSLKGVSQIDRLEIRLIRQ